METDNIFPNNWKEIVREKKVILYNTGVGSMLSGREKHIEKMKWVFEVFQKHPEVVLWWRPHPLELGTIQSMIPHLEEQYNELRRWYKEACIGILDESTDLHRAIAISDAYYGDWSSVVQLYKVAKKPVLFENDNVKDMQRAAFFPGGMCIKDERVWFMQLNSNKIVKVDEMMSEVEEMISIPMENSFKHRLYNYHMIDIGSKLLLLLEKSKNIYEYNVETQTITSHSLGINQYRFHSEIIVEWNRKLWMFPYGDNTVLKYDYDTGSITEKSQEVWNCVKAAKCHEIIGAYVYMVNSGSNHVYRYNLVDDSCIGIVVGEKDSQYWGIKKAGDYFVLPHINKQRITLWNEENGTIVEMMDFPKRYECLDRNAYLDMFEKNGNIYIFPFYANMLLKVDIQKKCIVQVFLEEFFVTDIDSYSEKFRCSMYLCARQHNDHIYAYASYRNCWQIFDLGCESVWNGAGFEINSLEQEKMLNKILDNGTDDDSFCEGESCVICTLNNYIRDITDSCSRQCESRAGKDSIGARIYNAIINNDEEDKE